MIESIDFQKAVTPRPELSYLMQRVRKAKAAFYGDRRLYQYIPPFSKAESAEKLLLRRQRTFDHYDNYVESCIGIYCEAIFGNGQVRRSTGIEELDTYLSGYYDTWRSQQLAPMQVLLPETFGLMQWPDTTATVTTMADQKALGLWPRAQLIEPHKILNYEIDNDDQLEWISRKIKVGKQEYIEVYDDASRYVLDDKGLIQHSEPHGFNAIPAFRWVWREDHGDWLDSDSGDMQGGDYCHGHALFHGVINKSIACLNWTSQLVEAGVFHFHVQLVMDEPMLKRAQARGGAGNSKAFTRDGSPNEKDPVYLQPPAMPVEQLKDLVYNKTPEAIYRLARLRDRTSNASASGISKLMDAVPEMQALKAVANWFQEIDEEIVRFTVTNYQPAYNLKNLVVSYPTSFDLTTAADDIAQITALAIAEFKAPDMPKSRTAVVELKLQAIMKLMPDLPEATRKTIEDELRAEPEPPPDPSVTVMNVQPSQLDPLGADATNDGMIPDDPAAMPDKPAKPRKKVTVSVSAHTRTLQR